MPRQPGHARYTIADLLVQSAMQMLCARGVAPEAAKGFAGKVARAAFLSIVHRYQVYSEKVKAAVEDLLDASGGQDERMGTRDAAREAFLAHLALKQFGLNEASSKSWLVIWANGATDFFDDNDDFKGFFAETQNDEFMQGPVIVFWLPAIAQVVIDRLPRPAIKLAED